MQLFSSLSFLFCELQLIATNFSTFYEWYFLYFRLHGKLNECFFIEKKFSLKKNQIFIKLAVLRTSVQRVAGPISAA